MLKKLWENKTKEIIEFFGKITSITIGLLWFLIESKWTFLSAAKNYIDPPVASVGIMLSGYAFSQVLANWFGDERILSKIDAANEKLFQLLSKVEVTSYSSFNDKTAKDLFAKFAIADEVINTNVATATSYKDYRIKMETKIIDAAVSLLLREKKWHDLLSSDTVSRAGLISSRAPGGEYRARQMNIDIPLINFVIIKYDAKIPSDVFFGFGLHEMQVEGRVYQSANPALVATFEAFYDTLSSNKYSQPIH